MSPRASASMARAVQALGIPVAALVRVSTEGQADDSRGGLPRQYASIARTVEANGLKVIKTVELHVSGTVAPSHPEMLAIFKMISDGEIRGIVTDSLDRIFRPDQPQGFAALQIFQDTGAKIFTSDSVLDLSTASGFLLSSIRGTFAGFELSLIRERLHGAKEAKRRQGKFPSSKVNLPLGIGYTEETWRFTPDIVRVKRAFEMFDQEGNRNYSAIGREIGLGPASVKVVLKNPIYTGWRIIDKKRGPKRTSSSGKIYRLKVARTSEDVIRVKVLDGIVSEECFERVQREMEAVKFNHHQRFRANQQINLGTGLLYCGCCTAPMFFISGRGEKRAGQKSGYVVCRNNHYLYKKRTGGCKQRHLRNQDMDDAVIRLTSTVLRSPENLARILEASNKRSAETITPFAKVIAPSAQLEELARRDKRVVEAYEAGAMSVEELRTKREAIRREKAAMEKVSEEKPTPGKTEFLQMARVIVKAAYRFSKITDKRQQRQIINEIFESITVRQNQITEFRIRPSVLAGAGVEGSLNEVVLLPKPIWVGKPPDVLPDGHKRCIKCSEVKPQASFYRGKLNTCTPCRTRQTREQLLRRKACAQA